MQGEMRWRRKQNTKTDRPLQIMFPFLSNPQYACGILRVCGRRAAKIPFGITAAEAVETTRTICRNVQYEFLKHDLVTPISLSTDPPEAGITIMLTEISYVASPSSTRYDGTLRMSCAILNGSNASRVITHGLIVLAKFFALNAPKGRVSGICISRAVHVHT